MPKPHLQGFKMTKIGLKLAHQKTSHFSKYQNQNFRQNKKIYTTLNNITIIVLKNETLIHTGFPPFVLPHLATSRYFYH